MLGTLYPWVKALHVVAVISWMAGLLYLPRLFVYHAERASAGSETEAIFWTMEERLLRYIMTPAMLVAWFAGIVLAMTPGVVDWAMVWPWSKLAGILAMTAFHLWLSARTTDFANGRNGLTGRTFRVMNEVPTILMLVIVVSVIVKI